MQCPCALAYLAHASLVATQPGQCTRQKCRNWTGMQPFRPHQSKLLQSSTLLRCGVIGGIHLRWQPVSPSSQSASGRRIACLHHHPSLSLLFEKYSLPSGMVSQPTTYPLPLTSPVHVCAVNRSVWPVLPHHLLILYAPSAPPSQGNESSTPSSAGPPSPSKVCEPFYVSLTVPCLPSIAVTTVSTMQYTLLVLRFMAQSSIFLNFPLSRLSLPY